MLFVRLMALIVLLMPTIITAQVTDEVMRSSLKGNVKSVHERSFVAKGRRGNNWKGKPKREYNWQHDYFIVFDTMGNKTEKVIFGKDGSIERILRYRYDQKRFMTGERIFDALNHPMDSTLYMNTYDSTGRIHDRVISYGCTRTSVQFIYYYDALGNIRENFKDISGSTLKVSRTFDNNWNVYKWYTYTKTEQPEALHCYTYDNKDRMIADSLFMPLDKLAIIYKWEYDEDGNILRREVCGPSGMNCEAWTFVYTFDQYGNWTEAVEYRNGKPAFIKERTITYY